MKKLLFALPIIALLAAGCNSTQTTKSSITTTPTPTSNLKTYTDSDYGFTFQYPADAQITISGQEQKIDAQIKHITITKGDATITISVVTPQSYQAATQACDYCGSYSSLDCEQQGFKSCIQYETITMSGDTKKRAFILDTKTNNKIQMTTLFSLQFNNFRDTKQLTGEYRQGASEDGDKLMQQWVNQDKLPPSDYEEVQMLNQVYSTFKFTK